MGAPENVAAPKSERRRTRSAFPTAWRREKTAKSDRQPSLLKMGFDLT